MAYETPWQRLTEAAHRYSDAGDDDNEFAREKDNLRKSALHYATQALIGKDREVKIVVILRRPAVYDRRQLCLWPVRQSVQFVRRLATG